MPFPTDGVYIIKNTGRDLVLDLKNNSTAEGIQIQGYKWHRGSTGIYMHLHLLCDLSSHASRVLVGDQETK
jgi:hypothetical protein